MPSAVWESFEKTNDGTEVVCLLCDKHLKYRSSTTSMRQHLQYVHGLKLKLSLIETNSECDDDASSESNAKKKGSSSSSATSVSELSSRPVTDISAQSGPSGESSQRALVSRGQSASICKESRRFVSHERKEAISQAIANMTAIDMLPLSLCENEGFKKLMEVVEPAYEVPTRHTIEKRIEIMGRDLQAIVVADLKEAEAITFASDGWTSLAVVPYETVTGHYINKKWEAICVTLSTESMEESHTGENIAERIYSVAADLNIEDKVMAVVHDNAANMKVAARILEMNYGIKDHIRCAAHTLQLCMNSGLEKFTSIIENASKLVGHFKHSHKATGALHNMQLQLDLPKERLIQNCKTRWNSTYYMTCRLLKHRTAVTAVLSDRTITAAKDMLRLEIPEANWCIIEQISLALHPFEIVTTSLCADKKATLSMVRPIMHSLLVNHLRPGITDTQLISEFKETVAGNIRRRFELEVEITVPKYVRPAQLASLLDPRYKKLDCEPFDSTKRSIREALSEQYDQLKIQRGSRGVIEEPQVQSPARPSNALDFIFNRQVYKDNELDAYLVTSQADMHTDPLTWWRIHEPQYPVLAQLAKKYLAIPATSASAERVFSCAGNIVTAKRSCLSPDHVNLLIYIHQNKHLI